MNAGKSMSDVTAKPAVSLVSLVERFGADEDRCRAFLAGLRWPEGVRCPKPECDSDKVSTIQAVTRYRKDTTDGKHKRGEVRGKRSQYECSRCGHQFSVTAGTVFHDTHLPLWKWFLATYLMCDSMKGVSANQLRRELAVSYKTAWYLCHRIRSAMESTGERLSGTVEMDETFIGGKAKSGSKAARRSAHNGSSNKVMVMGAVQRDGAIRLQVTGKGQSPTTRSVDAFIAQNVVSGAQLYSDQSNAYQHLPNHESVDHSAKEWVRGDATTNGIESAWSLLKRSIVGSYHQLSEKHLQSYMDEFSFRFNNRENPFLFRDTLLALCKADSLPYDELVGRGS